MSASVRIGFFAALAAYLIWGFLPLYFRLLGHISPEHMLAHRILWSVPTGIALVLLARTWPQVLETFRSKRAFWLALSAVLIGLNWVVYIWAVSQERVMEASLGYFINPLVNVAVGAVFLSERLRRWQWVAVGLAGVGVGIEAFALGKVPYISLVLCFTFAAYSLIRKQVLIDGRAGFLVEVLILMPFASLWMVWFIGQGNPPAGNGGWDWLLLAASGPITATPLICFALAAKRLKLSTIGMMQYIGPTIQFLLALSFGETFTFLRGLAFALIWSALIVFTLDSVAEDRRGRRAARAAAATTGNRLPQSPEPG